MARKGAFHEVGPEGVGEGGQPGEVGRSRGVVAVGPGPDGRPFQSPSAPAGRPQQPAEQPVFVAPPLGAAEQFRDDEFVEQELAVEVPRAVGPALAQLETALESDQGIVRAALHVFGGPQAGQGQEVMGLEHALAGSGIPHHGSP